MWLQGIISAWKWFENLLYSKFQKKTEKKEFMVLRALFSFEAYIQQRWYFTGGNYSWSVTRRKKTFKNNKEIHYGCIKMQKYIIAGCIKGFLIIC